MLLNAKAFQPIEVPDSTRIASPMAREVRSPIARDDSQLFPCGWSTAERCRQRIDRIRHEAQTIDATSVLDDETIARQPLSAHDLAQVVGEVLQRREAARFGVEVFEIKTPAAFLAAAMFTHQPIEPSFQATRQIEIRPVDGEHERFIQNAGVEPVR